MSVPLARRNLIHDATRTLLALSAVTFAVVLLFIQLALYETVRLSSHVLTDLFEYDLLLVSAKYSSIQAPGTFPITRLYQARAVAGVRSACPIYFTGRPWRDEATGGRNTILVIGAAPADPVFVSAEVRDQFHLLHETGTALMDRRTLPIYGPIRDGLRAEAGDNTLSVVGLFSNGGGYGAGGILIVSDRTINVLGSPLDSVSLGLVRLNPGTDPAAAAAVLNAELPPDVRAVTRAALQAREESYWVNTKPIGIMFKSGMYVGLAVGMVILYQVLAGDVARRLREYSTMKAMGYRERQINTVVLQQGGILAGTSYLLALGMSVGLYGTLNQATGLPLTMTPGRAGFVLGLTLFRSAVSGFLALRKLRAADPADLF
ncbi:MAG: ABC transporter permease [Fimbriiglobus sp.]